MFYKFNFNFKDINGNVIPIAAANAGKVLGEAIWGSNLSNSLAMADMAHKIFNQESVDISDEQITQLKDFIDKNEQLTVLSKNGLLKSIQEQQNKNTKKEEKKGK